MFAARIVADAVHRREALEAGFDECLTKPLPIKDLLDVLNRVAGRRKRQSISAPDQLHQQFHQRLAERRLGEVVVDAGLNGSPLVFVATQRGDGD